jgi:hypothetical protein
MHPVRPEVRRTRTPTDMTLAYPTLRGTVRAVSALTLMLLGCFPAQKLRAQANVDWQKPPVLPRAFDLTNPDISSASSPTAPRANRIRLFRITPGFISDPVGLDCDDNTDPTILAQTENGPDWVGLSLGNDNPFFDIRRPGDPGGIGYYRVHSQVQLFDSRMTACTLNLQAVTPAGRDQNGLADGPTVVTPGVAIYHELDDGTALQGFVGKHVHLNSGWSSGYNRNIQYGMAVQRPLIDPTTLKIGSLYWYVGALGRYRFDTDPTNRNSAWELMPGLHWQVSDSWWFACGFILPIGTPQPSDARLWQMTCSFRY